MNIEALTMAEIARVEELAHAPIAWLGNEERPQAALLTALAFVVKRREDNKYTFKQAQNLTMDELWALIGSTDESSDDDEDSPKAS